MSDHRTKAFASRIAAIFESPRHAFDLIRDEPHDISLAGEDLLAANGSVPPYLADLKPETLDRIRESARKLRELAPSRPTPEPTSVDEAVEETGAQSEAEGIEVREKMEKEWAARERFEADAERRLAAAQGNANRLSRHRAWLDGRRAELEAIRSERKLAEEKWQRTKARLAMLEQLQARLRAEQQIRLHVPGEDRPLTLGEFETWRDRHDRK